MSTPETTLDQLISLAGSNMTAVYEARTTLGLALYPDCKGDSPVGTANTLWAFAKKAASRLDDARQLAQHVVDTSQCVYTGATGGKQGDCREYDDGPCCYCRAKAFLEPLP